jgi:hypothetical protein
MALSRYEDAAVSAFEALNYEDNEEIKQLMCEAVKKRDKSNIMPSRMQQTKIKTPLHSGSFF